jgi:hypothetical protein
VIKQKFSIGSKFIQEYPRLQQIYRRFLNITKMISSIQDYLTNPEVLLQILRRQGMICPCDEQEKLSRINVQNKTIEKQYEASKRKNK